jgi:threonyl-tRNA synthetase
LLGSLERFFGILIEHYNGNFPLWLAPVQIIILPLAERHHEYALALEKEFKAKGLRSQVDLSREKIGHKIREAELQKIPLMLIVGDKELKNKTISLRVHGAGDKGEMPVADFVNRVLYFNENKSLNLEF